MASFPESAVAVLTRELAFMEIDHHLLNVWHSSRYLLGACASGFRFLKTNPKCRRGWVVRSSNSFMVFRRVFPAGRFSFGFSRQSFRQFPCLPSGDCSSVCPPSL